MGLRNLKVPQKTIKVGEGEDENFTVRGLSLRDVGLLADRHHTMLTALFSEFTSAKADAVHGKLSEESIAAKLPDLMAKAPELVSDIIALAAGDIDDSDVVNVISIPIQVQALREVFALTFRSEQDVKNVFETVIQGLRSMTNQIEALKS